MGPVNTEPHPTAPIATPPSIGAPQTHPPTSFAIHYPTYSGPLLFQRPARPSSWDPTSTLMPGGPQPTPWTSAPPCSDGDWRRQCWLSGSWTLLPSTSICPLPTTRSRTPLLPGQASSSSQDPCSLLPGVPVSSPASNLLPSVSLIPHPRRPDYQTPPPFTPSNLLTQQSLPPLPRAPGWGLLQTLPQADQTLPGKPEHTLHPALRHMSSITSSMKPPDSSSSAG